MSIFWDEYQIPTIMEWLKDKLPVTDGKLTIVTESDPEDEYYLSGYLDLEEKEFLLHVNLQSSLADALVSIVMGYSIVVSLSRTTWSGIPEIEDLVKAHEDVCGSLSDLNSSLARDIKKCDVILEEWLRSVKSRTSSVTEELSEDVDELIDSMSYALFSAPQGNKDYNVN